MVTKQIQRNLTAYLGGVIQVPDLYNIFMNAKNAVNQNLAFKLAALTKILPIYCIKPVRSFKWVKRNGGTLETFANDTR